MSTALQQCVRRLRLTPSLDVARTRSSGPCGPSVQGACGRAMVRVVQPQYPWNAGGDARLSSRPPHLGRNHGRGAGPKRFPREGEPVRQKRVQRRTDLRETSTRLKEIRVSPWQLNLVAKMVRGLTVMDAMANMKFSKKKHSATMMRAISNACNLADMRYQLQPEQLCIGEVFVTKGKVVKRPVFMAKGRVGMSRAKWSHLNVTVREIDFDAEIEGKTTKNGRRKAVERREAVEAALADAE
ncbi:unnamed protein product [Discosporangium mesarthrocarpum]